MLLDPVAGRVWALPRGEEPGSPRIDVPVGGVLQQSWPGESADEALVATDDALLAVPLAGGEPTVLADGFAGRAAAPVRLGACRYGAWSGGGGTVVTACDGAEPRVVSLGVPTSDLVFRVNRSEILLNDRTTGAVWNIDTEQPTRLDDWDAFKRKATEDEEEEEQEEEQQGDQRPPVANPDTLGARPGRTTVLHPLDNDTAPGGRLLSIRSVDRISGQAQATISPDGQTVQLTLPPGAAGRTSFVYYIDDGRDGKTAHATVTVPIRQPTENTDPRLRLGFEPRQWTVPAGGILDVPVLPDWRDRADGDPIVVTGADTDGGVKSGADARPTASGQLRVTAPPVGGPLEVTYTVSDGIGGDVERELHGRRAGPQGPAGVPGRRRARRDQRAGRRADHDLPARQRPARLRPADTRRPARAGRPARHARRCETKTDLVEGTVTFTTSVADTYFLDYDAAYGNAALAQGTIRVDVRNPERPPDEPVAMPDTALISGQRAVLVDVLRNDLDPAGGLLTVQGADGQGPDPGRRRGRRRPVGAGGRARRASSSTTRRSCATRSPTAAGQACRARSWSPSASRSATYR